MRDDFQHPETWYARRMHWRGAYRGFAWAINEVFHPRSVADVGCGHGWIVEWMAQKGIPAIGVEGSEGAFEIMPKDVRPGVLMRDLRDPVDEAVGQYELCVSIEVAEHIESLYEERFVDWVTQGERLFLTAAPPGQGGFGHVNLRAQEHWITLLARRGWRHDPDLVEQWMAAARTRTRGCPWVARNAMFFQRSRHA